MILLDAYALTAILTKGPAEHDVRALLRRPQVGIPLVNVSEVLDVVQRTRGMSEQVAWAGVEPFLERMVDALPLTVAIARRAGSLRAAHYHRVRRPLSLADCVLLASGAPGDRVATADPHVLAVAPLIELEPIPLPTES